MGWRGLAHSVSIECNLIPLEVSLTPQLPKLFYCIVECIIYETKRAKFLPHLLSHLQTQPKKSEFRAENFELGAAFYSH